MSMRLRLISGAALLVAGFFCGLALGRPSHGQSPQTVPILPGPPNARATEAKKDSAYHVVGTSTLSYVVVMKTDTGECWALHPMEHELTRRWVYLGSPTR